MTGHKLSVLLAAACLMHDGRSTTAGSAPAAKVSHEEPHTALLAADRRFASAAETADLVTALSSMFNDNVIMVVPATFTHGREAAIAALRGNPENPTSRVTWTPIKVGTSSDGRHGFTQGYITTTRASGAKVLGKYLSYWTRESGEWRVAVYKRMGRAAGDVSSDVYPPSVSTEGLPAGDRATVARFERELREAETSFSNEAAKIGIGPAFEKWGADDALNVGNGASWILGPAAIAAGLSAPGSPPPAPGTGITWSSAEVLVAATGDLGVSIGFIRRHGPDVPPDAPGQPFFTIWKRATPSHPWRYVAE
jgi:ketosteroid isomerase-like protein